jgi:hypothetical protein
LRHLAELRRADDGGGDARLPGGGGAPARAYGGGKAGGLVLALGGLALGFTGSAGGFLSGIFQFGGEGAQGWRGQRIGEAYNRHRAAYRAPIPAKG